MSALAVYRLVVRLLAPLLPILLVWRAMRGREIWGRLGERRGRAPTPRPDKPVVWLHAASVGETLSILPLLDDIRQQHPGLHYLLTTGTVTSAAMVAKQMAQHNDITHQFVPLDHPTYLRRFFAHWQPALGVLVESEIWPNLIAEAGAHRLPLVLLNARMSPKSFSRWQARAASAAAIFDQFALLLAQDETTATRLRKLTAQPVITTGNLKLDAPPLAADAARLAEWQAAIGARPLWLAASTHHGEEDAAAACHMALRPDIDRLLTVIAPRHPQRGDTVRAQLSGLGLRVAQRSRQQLPGPDTDVFLVDTIGEMGVLYRLTQIALIGGTLVPHGGQNPMEAARLDCAILHGPSVDNFTEIFDTLHAAQAVHKTTEAELAPALRNLLTAPETAQALAARAAACADNLSGARAEVLSHLQPFLPEAHHG